MSSLMGLKQVTGLYKRNRPRGSKTMVKTRIRPRMKSTLAETRTPNLLIKSQLLCQLSYQGILVYNRD